MVITEINLKELMEQYQMAPIGSYDTFSITLSLNSYIRKYNYSDEEYDDDIYDD